MKKLYLNDFKDFTQDEILDEFEVDEKDRKGIEVLFASYGNESYDGEAFLLVEKDNKLYEVNADHCSCYGLEDQFELEETSIELIEYRLKNVENFGSDQWSTGNVFRNELIDFIEEYKNNEKS